MEWKLVVGNENGCFLIYFLNRKLGYVFESKGIEVKIIVVDVKRWDDKSYEWKDFKF